MFVIFYINCNSQSDNRRLKDELNEIYNVNKINLDDITKENVSLKQQLNHVCILLIYINIHSY